MLVGLVLVSAGVEGGDAWAALFVAVLVLVAAVRLGIGNVHVLIDRAPIGLAGESNGPCAGCRACARCARFGCARPGARASPT